MSISIEVAGVSKAISGVSLEVGGAWKSAPNTWKEVGGVWKQVMSAQGAPTPHVWQFVGSSSTLGLNASPYTNGFVYRTADYLGWTAPDNSLFVDGVSSSDIGDFQSRFAANCDIHYNADGENVVFLQHGINDAGTAAQVYAALVSFCSYVKGLHATNPWKVVVGTNQYPKHGASVTFNGRVEAYEAMYMDNPDFHDGTIADGVVWPHTRLALTNSNSNRYDTGGLHMNNLGHDIYGQAVSEELLIALTGQARLLNRPTVSITSHNPYSTVAGTITVSVTVTGATELELYAGAYDATIGNGALLLQKVGDTVGDWRGEFVYSGSWQLDTTIYPEANVQIAVSAKSYDGLGNSTAVWVRAYQLAASGAPAFAAPPVDGEFANGAAISLSAVATGDATITYQWESNLEGTWTTITGATASTYDFTCLIETLGSYRCTATNSVGALTTEPAVIRMTPGSVTIHDTFSGATGTIGGRTPDKVGAVVWTGTYGVSSGTAYTSNTIRAHIETGLSTGMKLRCLVRLNHASATPGPIVRCNADATNYIRGQVTLTQFRFRDNASVLGTAYTFPTPKNVGDWIVVEICVVGNVFTAYVDGALVNTLTIATYPTNTRAGLGNGGSYSVSYDMFEVSPYAP